MDKVRFRRALNRIGNHLSRQNFDDLKFVCKDVVPVARMERVRVATDLFQALEERGKLAVDDLEFLTQVLSTVGCGRLLSELEGEGFIAPRPPSNSAVQVVQLPGQPVLAKSKDYLFNEYLLKIGQGMSSKDVEMLSYTWSDSLLGMSSDRVFSANQLLQLLQQRQIITPDDLHALYDELHQIGRSDLAQKINEYCQRTNQAPYDVLDGGSQGGIRQRQGGPYNYQTQPVQASEEADDDPMDSPHSSLITHTSYPSSISTVTPMDPYNHYPHHTPTPESLFSEISRDPVSGPRSGFERWQLSPDEHSPFLSATKNPYNLTFNLLDENEGDEELYRPSMLTEGQNLLAQLAQKEIELRSKEHEMEQLRGQLNDAQQHTEGILSRRIGEVEVYKTSLKELEEILQTKNTEVEDLRLELQHFHDEVQALRAARPINPDELYKLDKNPHGLCLIINNHKFYHPTDPDKAHNDRGGADIDQFNLTQTFRYLRYKVEVKENLTSDEMVQTLIQLSQRDHSNYDSFVCCILTHGEKETVHGADSIPVNLFDLTGMLKYAQTLAGKPKMFFIQACRGETEDKGVAIEKDSGGNQPGVGSIIPQEADFFFGYATPLGNAAYRSRRHGSWYISELCKVFTQSAYHSNLSSMMKKVNFQVSKAFTKDGLKQCSEYVDRLRSEVHFFHFIRPKPKQ